MLLVWPYKILPALRCMTLLGPPYFVYPCERREFVFDLELLGMANLCPSAVTLFTLLESLVFCFGIILGVYLLDRLTRVLFFFPFPLL